jgi:hypothetical protein
MPKVAGLAQVGGRVDAMASIDQTFEHDLTQHVVVFNQQNAHAACFKSRGKPN